jgi:hypothetical protein
MRSRVGPISDSCAANDKCELVCSPLVERAHAYLGPSSRQPNGSRGHAGADFKIFRVKASAAAPLGPLSEIRRAARVEP